jgi:hypothetical protein
MIREEFFFLDASQLTVIDGEILLALRLAAGREHPCAGTTTCRTSSGVRSS